MRSSHFLVKLPGLDPITLTKKRIPSHIFFIDLLSQISDHLFLVTSSSDGFTML